MKYRDLDEAACLARIEKHVEALNFAPAAIPASRVRVRMRIPDDKVLIPGVLDTTTNFIEHPRLVAQRLQGFVDIVGSDRVIAGSDCGLGTFAGFGAVDANIVYAKPAAMRAGVDLMR